MSAMFGHLPSTVHPHVRGDNSFFPARQSSRRGPSPRAWGQLEAYEKVEVAVRSIPTCVGTTYKRDRLRRALFGPSPRAWGQHLSVLGL